MWCNTWLDYHQHWAFLLYFSSCCKQALGCLIIKLVTQLGFILQMLLMYLGAFAYASYI